MDLLPSMTALPPASIYIPLLATILCFVIHHLVYSKRIRQWKASNIPFLKPTFLIGHKYFLGLFKNAYQVPLDRIYRETPDKEAVGFFLGAVPLILLRSPRLIQQVFARNSDKAFATGWDRATADEEVNQNLIHVSSDKESWKSGRKKMAPYFTTARMAGAHFNKVKKQVDNLLAYAHEAQASKKPVNTSRMVNNYVADTILLLMFGQNTNSYTEKKQLYKMFTDFEKPGMVKLLAYYAQMQFPGVQWVPESLKIINRNFINAMSKFLNDRIQHKKAHKTHENDLVDFLMALKDGGVSEDGSFHSGINMKQMAGMSLTFTSLGFLGAKLAASFAIHLLSLHPEYQDKIRREVAAAMKKHNTAELTFEVVQELRFTEQCILETERLYTIFPAVMRICTEDFQVPGTDYTFRKGDKLIMDPYSVHRDPKYFENPDSFSPERFSPENKDSISPESLLSFGQGPRKCPGAKLANTMVVTAIASLVLNYNIKPYSHQKAMDATDFHPRSFFNYLKEDIHVNLVPVLVQ